MQKQGASARFRPRNASGFIFWTLKGFVSHAFLARKSPELVTHKKEFFRSFFLSKMHASLGCGALSAKCTAGPNAPGCFFCFLGRGTGLCRSPLPKPPFLGSWKKDKQKTNRDGRVRIGKPPPCEPSLLPALENQVSEPSLLLGGRRTWALVGVS